LLKNVKFHSLSLKSLKDFLNSIYVDDIEFELFDQIKNEFQNLKENNEKILQENNKFEKENEALKEEL
jgi:wyosine [tRNA(Phe)-imidazoG37] synthetase (radical SAM superfamily)